MERLYGLHRDAKGAIAIQPYEGAVLECECEPADSSRLKRSAGQWADLQVETAVLQEAANQYKARHGRLPESLNELTRRIRTIGCPADRKRWRRCSEF